MVKILTLIGNNYGCCLQAYALQKVVSDLGYDVETLSYDEYMNKSLSVKNVMRLIIYANRNIKYRKFRTKYMHFSTFLRKLTDDGDVYIVGSDQVWNQRVSFNIRKHFFLDFVKDKNRKIAYAASIADKEIDSDVNNLEMIKKYLKDFKQISVREKSAEKMLKDILNITSTTVLDPTMLLNGNDWIKTFNIKNNNSNNILVYTLGINEQCLQPINDFCVRKGLKIDDIFYKKRFKHLNKLKNNCGPIEFLDNIYNSSFVITNSFHGTVFSILFHKEFLVITRGNMNDRIYDLLNNLGIKNRIIKEENINSIKDYLNLEPINYKEVDKILENERIKSLEFLKNSLLK